MGASNSKKNRSKPRHERINVKNPTDKTKLLQEPRAHNEKEMVIFACKEAEWAKEKKKLKDEVKMMKKLVEEKDEKIRQMEDCSTMVVNGWPLLGTSYLLEQMKEERARRDEVVEKWKQLYLDIKNELDDLIQRTQGDSVYWKAEEEKMIEEMKKELKTREETIKALKTQLASMEKKGYERKREMDILKQSLRILDSKTKANYTSNKRTTLAQYFKS